MLHVDTGSRFIEGHVVFVHDIDHPRIGCWNIWFCNRYEVQLWRRTLDVIEPSEESSPYSLNVSFGVSSHGWRFVRHFPIFRS